MITIKLKGGLGNQMFQYAIGRRLSLKHGVPLELDLSYYAGSDKSRWCSGSRYELDCFNIMERKYDTRMLLAKLGCFLNKPKIFQEKNRSFDSSVLDAPRNSYLVGYWQCEKYFKDVEAVIRQDFTFKDLPNKKNAAVLEEISNSNSVSIHLRRGDYVCEKSNNRLFGVPSLENYYYPAIKLISKKTSGLHFFVFSDDPVWGKENLELGHPATFVDHNPPDKGFEDMRLMSTCKHHILANSSFSWWGAWLNPNPQKIVIAPSEWFVSDPEQNKIILQSWIRI